MSQLQKIQIKTKPELNRMIEGGKILSKIKKELFDAVKPGISSMEIEKLADKLISKSGGKASFQMVEGYKYATCVNVNEGIVHGIPKDDVVFSDDDIVSIDVGLFYKDFHTDTSISKYLGKNASKQKFLETGKAALSIAIKNAKIGKYIFDISSAMEKKIHDSGYQSVKSLVGHGVGRELHEEPQIPCFTYGNRQETPRILEGLVIAIEVMYTFGDPELMLLDDGWTIATRDGKISGLFEETVAVTKNGPLVLT